MATILIADDEEAIRRLLTRVLSSAGHQVLTAGNGMEAVALFRSYHYNIDLIITDMVMPAMGGDEVVNLVHQTKPDAKIICMSGYSDRRCPSGVVFLRKPFGPADLRKTVEEALSRG